MAMEWPPELGSPMAMDRIVHNEHPAASDRTSRVLRLADGRRIGYAEYGDPQGQPVLAIHGTPGSRFMFALTDEAARERRLAHRRARAPGLRAFRFSPQGRSRGGR